MSSPQPTAPYAALHADPKGAGDGRPTATRIIEDEDLVDALPGKVMLITGTTSGIGIDTVRALHLTGADIYMQARNLAKAEQTRSDILTTTTGKGKLEILLMDLTSLESVRQGVAQLLTKTKTLNILINNAGVRNTPEGRTVDGFETQFAVNHLAHFLLFELLRPTLLASSTPTFHSRVVNVTSGSHRGSQVNFENPNLDSIYAPRLAYSQSKTANILMANEIERRFGPRGLHGLSVHPGCIITGLQVHDLPTPEEKEKLLAANPVLAKVMKSTTQGAATQVWAAVAKVWEGKGGVYLEECRLGHQSEEPDLENGGVKAYCFDQDAQQKLWDLSCRMVGVDAADS
ncbi:putative short-chain dehydrogenase [Xylariaceae sp. FL0255]|nr:putative short-chain dehydrogenase [Xylariaceae sp. FL0255]